MTGARVCITNLVPDMRSCTITDEHLAHCDGFARRWDDKAGRVVILDSECRGCVPRPAEVGHLCYSHLTKLDAALHETAPLVRFMMEDGSNGIRDTNTGGGASSAGPRWPLSESRIRTQWIAAAFWNAAAVLDRLDEDLTWTISCADGLTERVYVMREAITVDLTYLDRTHLIPLDATPARAGFIIAGAAAYLDRRRDELISTPRGAEAAVRAIAVVQAGYAKFPLVEREHRVVGIRCPACAQPRLVWTPPLMHRGDVVIRCAGCGHAEPQEWLEQYAAVMQLRPVQARA